jgi:chromate transport protein ChrA
MEERTTTPAYSLRQLVQYFFKLGYVGFGGPLALVGYMHRDLVEERKWISEEEYKDGLALAQLAPGPLAAQLGIYLGYVHYRVVGATLAGLAFVLPSFVMVVLIGMAYKLFGGLPWMQAIFYGVGAAVVGIIAISSYKLTEKIHQQVYCQCHDPTLATLGLLYHSSSSNHYHPAGRSFIICRNRVVLHDAESTTKMDKETINGKFCPAVWHRLLEL